MYSHAPAKIMGGNHTEMIIHLPQKCNYLTPISKGQAEIPLSGWRFHGNIGWKSVRAYMLKFGAS